MRKTSLDIQGDSFFINGNATYSEIPYGNPDSHGLLMNARFIQGIFDDQENPDRFARFGRVEWDPEQNTSDLIAALPEWYAAGLRAFTVGFQGGGPCFTIDNNTILNNPFGEDGRRLDPAYAARMDRLIRAADDIGMVVIVSFFYHTQARRIRDGMGIRNAVSTASRFLREGGYTNVIIEIANEQDVLDFAYHPIIAEEEGMALLIECARRESGGLPVGCSSCGGVLKRQIAQASDVILIHGNSQSRQHLYNLIGKARELAPGRPIVCNEDSPAIGQLAVALKTHTSWGYYNNMTKQEPPADWRITEGEDRFFAMRMAWNIGIERQAPPIEEQFFLQGLEPGMVHDHKRWIRLASLYPERIDHVDFFVNGDSAFTCYDEPFAMNWVTNWLYRGVTLEPGDQITAAVHLTDGSVVEKLAEPAANAAAT